ncbi:MAG: redoxin domain-containing protein [Acidobacteria bacterium]|nr:redoxin domain-containing protein [Acidobacteriota bacterium]
MELQDRIDDLRAQGLGVAAVSYDTEEVLAAFAERRGVKDVPLLSDDDSAVIRAFGIYNHIAEEGIGPNAEDPDVKADVNQYVSVFGANPMIVGTPFPGTFIVDREGRVTSRFFEEFYRERNTAANIMLKLGTPISGIAGSSGETAHLEISASQSNPDILVGSRFHLALDITPKPKMHVYAPGAEELGYRVIGLELEVPSFLRVLPAEYPASEIYHFEPLDEHVPVYQRPFRLVQEIVVEGDPESAAKIAEIDALTLTGRLDYQACDDAVCFNPASVPLTWTLTVSPLDRQRALAARQ